MQLEVLNNFTGDNKIELDTDTEEGKQKVAEEFQKLLKAGTAIFLERAGETYRVTGYDPHTDKLMVEVHYQQPANTESAPSRPCGCGKCEGCTNNVAQRSRTGVCSPCQQGKHGGRKITVAAKPRAERNDRVTAVAPRSGG